MRCLVTGVAGFIGSNLAERLLADGHEVVGADCFTANYDPSIKRRNVEALRSQRGFELVETDLAESDLSRLVEGMGWVFHLAGQPGVRESWGTRFTDYVRNNIQATQHLLEAMAAAPPSRLVYASSSSVYGDVPLPMAEDARPEPVSPYGVTKLTAEHLVRAYGKSHAIPVTALRFFTVYGPRQRPDMAFHRFIQAIAANEAIHLYGDGSQTRDFTYVDDVVDACLRAATGPCAGEVINVGGGSSVTINAVLDYLGKLLDRPVRVTRQTSQRGDVSHTTAATGRSNRLLGWYPETTWTEGLRRQVEWQVGTARLARSRTGYLHLASNGFDWLANSLDEPAHVPAFRATAPRLLLYGHDTYGLGHLRRNLAIAASLTRGFPDLSILLLTGSPAAQNFALPPNVDYVKLPAVVKVADEDYRARALDLQPKEMVRLRAALIRETMVGFAPDVVLVDHAPLGMKGELVPALMALRGVHPRAQVALGLRDIVDQPDRVRHQWETQGVYSALERLYDSVLVYGTQEVLDVATAYHLSPEVAEKTRYCGYLRREIDPAGVAAQRARFSSAGERLVVVTAGGGGDGFPLLRAYLAGRKTLGIPGVASVVVTGPFMPATERDALADLARGDDRVQVVDFVQNLPALFQAADLVVCMGGYNTLCEVLSAGVPALVVPRTIPRREQLLRASAFADLGLVTMLPPDELTPSALAEQVADLLKDELARARTQQAITSLSASGGFDGLEATAAAIGELIGQASPAFSRQAVAR